MHWESASLSSFYFAISACVGFLGKVVGKYHYETISANGSKQKCRNVVSRAMFSKLNVFCCTVCHAESATQRIFLLYISLKLSLSPLRRHSSTYNCRSSCIQDTRVCVCMCVFQMRCGCVHICI